MIPTTTPTTIRSFQAHRIQRRALFAGALFAVAAASPALAVAAGPEDIATPEATAEATAPPPVAASADNHDSYLPSLSGPIGLYHMSTAEVGPAHHVRLALHGQYFTTSQMLTDGDKDTMLSGALTFGFTPMRYLEIFGGVLTSSNRNERTDELGRTDPTVIRSHGDLLLGPKVAFPVANGLDLGFEVGMRFLASASSLAFSASSTSVWVGPMVTADMRPMAGIPLRFHLGANYYVDNSKNVYTFPDTTTPQSRQATKLAYDVGASRVRLALGVDAPLEQLTAPVPLQPFVEYHAEIITANADPTLEPAATSQMMPLGPRDRQWLTFGLRARVYRGLTFDGGADVRLRSNGLAYER